MFSNYGDLESDDIDQAYADDGFGNMVLINLAMFWYNADRAEASRVGNIV
jgi:hypothetical protein